MIKRLLSPPIFEDESKSHQARLLNVILWALVIVPFPYISFIALALPNEIQRALIQGVVGETINIFLLFLLRRGRVKEASSIQVAAFWLFFTVTAYTSTGVRSPAYLLGYGLVISIAGILLGGRGAILMTALSIFSGAAMARAEIIGQLQAFFIDSTLAVWIISAILFPVGAILQYLSSRELRHALRRANASEERYRLISSVTTDYTFSTIVNDDGSLKLKWVAGAFERMTGYTYEEYVAAGGWLAHVHPEDLAKDAHDMEILRRNQDVKSEIRTFDKNGEIRWERIYAHPVWDDKKNRLIEIVGAVQDVTEQKRAEAEREALIAELEGKNAELERFTYTVSHDLRSPLVTISGFIGYIEKDIASGNKERIKQNTSRILQAVEKMQNLLNDLLELSRIGRLMNAPEDVDLNETVKDALELLSGVVDAYKIKVVVHDNLPTVCGDQVRLREVMQNLLENAVKFMGNQAYPKIEIGTRGMLKGMPIIFVRDNGIGVEPEFHDKVFGLFNKLDASSEGTGIGLTIVKRIIEVHGGRIWLESKGAYQGTTFCFTLPVPTNTG